MKFPTFKERAKICKTTNKFKGIQSEKTEKTVLKFDGYFAEANNVHFKNGRMKARAVRKLLYDGGVLDLAESNGITAVLYSNRICVGNTDVNLPTAVSEGRLIFSNRKLLLFPQKLAVDLENMNIESLDKSIQKSVGICLTDNTYKEIDLEYNTVPSSSVYDENKLCQVGSELYLLTPDAVKKIESPKTRIEIDTSDFSVGEKVKLTVGQDIMTSKIEYIGNGFMVLQDGFSKTHEGSATIEIIIPDSDVEIFYDGQLYLANSDQNEIYVSKVGSNTAFLDGDNAVKPDSVGEFTSAFVIDSKVCFGKENSLVRISKSNRGISYIQSAFRGIKNEKSGSFAKYKDGICYEGKDGICYYDGNKEKRLEIEIPLSNLAKSVFCEYQNEMYIDTESGLYVYSLDEECLSKFDKLSSKKMINVGDDILSLNGNGEVVSVFGKYGSDFGDGVEISAKTSEIYFREGYRVREIRVHFVGEGSKTLLLTALSEGKILGYKSSYFNSEKKIKMPLKMQKIDSLQIKIRLLGVGEIEKIVLEYEKGEI